ESFRGIRTSILLSSAESAPQVILVSSSGPREGKTLIAANAAVTTAQAGNKVLVLDCDMRRPRMHKLFGISRGHGISNLLASSSDIEGAIFHTRIPNLDVMPCGPIPPNPSEILGSKRMVSLLGTLREQYTRIIIDSPPATAVTDAVVISKSVDGVILVIRSGVTVRQIAKNGVAQFEAVGAPVIGAILNAVDLDRDSYYYYQYYYYYGEDKEKGKRSRRKKRPKKQYTEEA
ncbi:MAG: CpsD/CapB family tyrosine-protein kinase, partial [Deltaproteobacteria bacterium]|nr:CpsD/CapB family tyrosine-protein kinase [Deltaproteobacteria bacterium]